MNIPSTFYIKGKLWTVEYKWGLRGDDEVLLDGQCVTENRTIQIDRGIPKRDKWLVFLHEFIHAVLHESHVSGLDGSAGEFLEEIICESVANVLNDCFTIRWKRRSKNV